MQDVTEQILNANREHPRFDLLCALAIAGFFRITAAPDVFCTLREWQQRNFSMQDNVDGGCPQTDVKRLQAESRARREGVNYMALHIRVKHTDDYQEADTLDDKNVYSIGGFLGHDFIGSGHDYEFLDSVTRFFDLYGAGFFRTFQQYSRDVDKATATMSTALGFTGR